MRSHLTPTIAVGLLLTITACNGRSNEEVLVSAAASLTDAFSEIEAVYEETHAGVDVVLNFAGSSTLREQILEGAPVDVFASANQANMDEIVRTDMHLGEPMIFATNLLQIAVAAGNPAGVTGLGDFADEGLLIGLCAPDVPCGDFARQILSEAGIVAAIDTNEPDVRALLTKIEVGELDAGIVYATDILAVEGSVEGIDIPEALNVVAEYPIAVIVDAPNPDGGAAFVEFVFSDEGRAVLDDYGFVSP